MHWLSAAHRDYLAVGGKGFILSDGRLDYGTERIFETYYRVPVSRSAHLGPDFSVHRPTPDTTETAPPPSLRRATARGVLTAGISPRPTKLYRRTGKQPEAQEDLVTATMMNREMDMRFWLEQAEAEMRELA